VRAAAQTFRANPELDTERAIQQLEVGEALVSFLHNNGEPSVVQRALVRPPMSRVGPLTREERRRPIEADVENLRKYRDVLDRESAHERLRARNSPVGQVKDKLRRFGNLFNVNR